MNIISTAFGFAGNILAKGMDGFGEVLMRCLEPSPSKMREAMEKIDRQGPIRPMTFPEDRENGDGTAVPANRQHEPNL